MKNFLYVLTAFLSVTAGVIGFKWSQTATALPVAEFALHYPQPRNIAAFDFTDEAGESFTNHALLNKWSLVFMGYTSCPDVCPMTLQKLQFAYDDILAISPDSQVLLVSVDPSRDTTDKLSQYIDYFHDDFKALRAEHDVLFPFSRSIGMMYAVTKQDNEESYWVDHSASIVLINPIGKVEAIFKPETNVGQVPHIDTNKLLSDYKKIVALYQHQSS